jgi:hypothetical protein
MTGRWSTFGPTWRPALALGRPKHLLYFDALTATWSRPAKRAVSRNLLIAYVYQKDDGD